jgi:hypothetical protein
MDSVANDFNIRRMTMTELTRRAFGKHALECGGALSVVAMFTSAASARTAGDPLKDNAFLQRDDLGYALKSLYTTYDSSQPYPHKFNDVLTKYHLIALDFFARKGLDKEYAQHYVESQERILRRIGKMAEKDGPDKGLYGMFEGTTCSYQLFERITIKPGERSFPCPYKGALEVYGRFLKTFSIEWKDVCDKWCTPTWVGFADRIGIKISVHPGEECRVKLA